MRGLRLPHARAIAADVLATARAQRWDPTEVIKALLTEETAGRARSMLAARRKAAGFPTGKTFDVWDPNASSIPLPTQQALQTLEWVGRRENLVVCGPAGTGKTFFLEALGQKVIEAGMPVAWFTLEQIGVLVRAHRTDDSLGKAVAKIVRA
jgi:DNA replication protein DnaC